MRKLISLICISTLLSCNSTERVFDSEIGAIRDQTAAIEKQNAILLKNQLIQIEHNRVMEMLLNRIEQRMYDDHCE